MKMKYSINKTRALSWSAISSFEYDPEQWFKRYVLNEKSRETGAMMFGKEIGEKLASDPKFMPEVPRLPLYEYKLFSTLKYSKCGDIRHAHIPKCYEELSLIGYIDAFDLKKKKMLEFKTGKKWDKDKAENHGQIDLYCAMIYSMHKIRPEELDINLVWMATEETGDFTTQFVKDMQPVVFPVKKTIMDVLNMLARVKRVYKEMEDYVEMKNKLST